MMTSSDPNLMQFHKVSCSGRMLKFRHKASADEFLARAIRLGHEAEYEGTTWISIDDIMADIRPKGE